MLEAMRSVLERNTPYNSWLPRFTYVKHMQHAVLFLYW